MAPDLRLHWTADALALVLPSRTRPGSPQLTTLGPRFVLEPWLKQLAPIPSRDPAFWVALREHLSRAAPDDFQAARSFASTLGEQLDGDDALALRCLIAFAFPDEDWWRPALASALVEIPPPPEGKWLLACVDDASLILDFDAFPWPRGAEPRLVLTVLYRLGAVAIEPSLALKGLRFDPAFLVAESPQVVALLAASIRECPPDEDCPAIATLASYCARFPAYAAAAREITARRRVAVAARYGRRGPSGFG